MPSLRPFQKRLVADGEDERGAIVVFAEDEGLRLGAEERAFLESTGAAVLLGRRQLAEAVEKRPSLNPALVLCLLKTLRGPEPRALRSRFPQAFLVALSPEAQLCARSRQLLTDEAGFNMVDRSLSSADLRTAIIQVFKPLSSSATTAILPSSSPASSSSSSSSSSSTITTWRRLYHCPYCQLGPLSEDELWEHCPLYHINAPNRQTAGLPFPICAAPCPRFHPHLRNAHGPPSRGEAHREEDGRATPRMYAFALVVCRRPEDGRFLLVQEYGGEGYWLPGGGVDAGENLEAAAERETLEEAGVRVSIKGVLRVEYTPRPEYVRLRVIFYAEPAPFQVEKTLPDYESLGAIWASPEEVLGHTLNLRGHEPSVWIDYLLKRGAIHPLQVLSFNESSLPPKPH